MPSRAARPSAVISVRVVSPGSPEEAPPDLSRRAADERRTRNSEDLDASVAVHRRAAHAHAVAGMPVGGLGRRADDQRQRPVAQAEAPGEMPRDVEVQRRVRHLHRDEGGGLRTSPARGHEEPRLVSRGQSDEGLAPPRHRVDDRLTGGHDPPARRLGIGILGDRRARPVPPRGEIREIKIKVRQQPRDALVRGQSAGKPPLAADPEPVVEGRAKSPVGLVRVQKRQGGGTHAPRRWIVDRRERSAGGRDRHGARPERRG